MKFADISGVAEVDAGDGLRLTFDRNTGTAAIVGADALDSVEAFDIDGRRVDASAIVSGNSATLTLPASGMNIIVVKDASGKGKTFKIVK
ncbi:MAG: T9SS type A sorting domain-containing protein [Muribaculaceae bacterium]|nr:T9SS type A sorting domain-containing protein [Muribaculaceae bacterium]